MQEDFRTTGKLEADTEEKLKSARIVYRKLYQYKTGKNKERRRSLWLQT